jgi:hypothetical protein
MRVSKLSLRKHIHKVTRRNVYESAARERMKDSRALQDAGRYIGAVYIGGYAIECYLKMFICARHDFEHLEDFEEAIEKITGRHPQLSSARGHQLEVLLDYSGLKDVMRAEKEIYHAFRIVNEWTEALRYYDGNGAAEQCNPFLKALEIVYHWLLARSI